MPLIMCSLTQVCTKDRQTIKENVNPGDACKNSQFKTIFVTTLVRHDILKMGLTALKTADS